ncbi:MAG: zinc ribbon domain-containing protein [Epulopiscium sp.]|nr:zinc ribbon domain-containing protein [Candidatus Epulonipiscium sp.]
MAKKRTSKNIPLPILILICALLLVTMYLSLSTLTLAIWGDSVMGTVDIYESRLDDSKAEPNRSRTVSKGYSFMANGKEYRGYVMYQSDESWPSLDDSETRSERIRYLDFFPYINKPAMLCEFDEMGEVAIIYHILTPMGSLFLLVLVLCTARGKKKKKTATRKPVAPQIIETRSDTDMFCSNCGNKLAEGAAFCSSCGAKIQANAPCVCTACGAKLLDDAEFCINCGTAVNSAVAEPMRSSREATSVPQQGGTGLVGFSDRYNSPEILAAAQMNKKYSIGCMWILVFVPLIGFPVAGLLMDDFPFGESLVIGVGLALIMFVVNLLALRRTKKPMWEGVVVNKYSKEKSENIGGDDDNWGTYTEYTTVITTDAGKKKTIVEVDSRRHMYDYLSVGDRVRYHPMFGTYEKYDKFKDRIIYCNVCNTMNPIQNDRCKRCNNLLFK